MTGGATDDEPAPREDGAGSSHVGTMTINDAARSLHPPIPRRELARRLKNTAPTGSVYGRRGRRAQTFPVDAILRAHAEWVRSRPGG